MHAIGIDAGKIWQYLHTNGAASVAKISQQTGLNPVQTQRAIGWLAKEGKLLETLKGRSQMLSLK